MNKTWPLLLLTLLPCLQAAGATKIDFDPIDKAINARHYRQAKELLARAMGKDCVEPRAYWTRAVINDDLGRPDLSLSDMDRAISLGPNLDNVYCMRGDIYAKTQNLPHAVLDYTQAIKLKPDHDYYFGRRGATYMQMHKWNEARQDLEKALQLNPKYQDVWPMLSNCYVNLGQPQKALSTLTKELVLAAKDNPLRLQRAMLFEAMHEPAKADEDLRAYGDANANNPSALGKLADTEIDLRRWKSAKATLTKLVKIAPGSLDTMGLSAKYHSLHGDTDDAIADYNRILQTDPRAMGAYLSLCFSYWTKHDLRKARAVLDQMLALRPRPDAATYAKGADLAGLCFDLAYSLNIADSGLAAYPTDTTLLAAKAKLLLKARKDAQAIETTGRILRLHPDNLEALAIRGLANFDLLNYRAAKQDLEAAYKGDQTKIDALAKLLECYGELGQEDKIRELAVTSIPYLFQSGSIEDLGHAGNVFAKCKCYDTARRCYETAMALPSANSTNTSIVMRLLGDLCLRQNDYKKAAYWLKKADPQGKDPYAQKDLATAEYHSGNFVEAQRLTEQLMRERPDDNQLPPLEVAILKAQHKDAAARAVQAKIDANARQLDKESDYRQAGH